MHLTIPHPHTHGMYLCEEIYFLRSIIDFSPNLTQISLQNTSLNLSALDTEPAQSCYKEHFAL